MERPTATYTTSLASCTRLSNRGNNGTVRTTPAMRCVSSAVSAWVVKAKGRGGYGLRRPALKRALTSVVISFCGILVSASDHISTVLESCWMEWSGWLTHRICSPCSGSTSAVELNASTFVAQYLPTNWHVTQECLQRAFRHRVWA